MKNLKTVMYFGTEKAQIKENDYRLEELTKFEKQLKEEKEQERIHTELQKSVKFI